MNDFYGFPYTFMKDFCSFHYTFMNDFCSGFYTLHAHHSAASGPNMRSSAWCSPFTIFMRAFTTAMWLVLPFRVAIGNRRWDGVSPIGY